MLANADAYASDTLNGSGHIRVTVSPFCATVDYVQAYLPIDTISGIHHNQNVAFCYTIGDCSTSMDKINESPTIKIFPNPASEKIRIQLPNDVEQFEAKLINALGQTMMKSMSKEIDVRGLPNGIYFVNIKTDNYEVNKKVIIRR
jgi:hypothetical protein